MLDGTHRLFVCNIIVAQKCVKDKKNKKVGKSCVSYYYGERAKSRPPEKKEPQAMPAALSVRNDYLYLRLRAASDFFFRFTLGFS